jgi:AhpD family alkylhydroperoxidase
MTTEQQNLSREQKELVAVGASVGAGCQPCVSHHLKAGAEAGLDAEQLLAAVTSAERVSAEAAVAMGDHAHGELGPTNRSPALLSRREETFASLGAALGANDVKNIERQLRAAADLGASRSQLEQAIETAHNVQESAARIHLREAERLLETLAPTAAASEDAATSGAGCGCGAGDEPEEPPATAEEPEPRAASSRHAGGCAGMAELFTTSGPSGAMAACREMFEHFTSASQAVTDKPPTATTAAGSSKKED